MTASSLRAALYARVSSQQQAEANTIASQVEALQARVRELAEEVVALRANQRRDVAVVPKSTALVVWQPRRAR